ncbi:hypothetical protein RJ641_033013, partial [Dillenia turbinata]
METRVSDAETQEPSKAVVGSPSPSSQIDPNCFSCEFFQAATVASLALCGGGWIWNLPVYLIEEFNVKSIDATQISNIVNGTRCLIPVLGAIIANSFFGCYVVVSISSCISLL